MLLVTVFQSETLDIVPFRSYSSSDAITFINRKNIERDVYVNFYSFFRSRVLFLFSIYQIRWFDWRSKEMSQRTHCQPQLNVDLVNGVFWVFLADLCAILSVKKSELHQKKPSIWHFFLYFSRGDFLQIDVFPEKFEHICRKAFYFRFFI